MSVRGDDNPFDLLVQDSTVSANTVTGNADDIFGLQDNLFAEVLEKLPTAVDPARRQSVQGRLDTKPARACDALAARDCLRNRGVRGMLRLVGERQQGLIATLAARHPMRPPHARSAL